MPVRVAIQTLQRLGRADKFYIRKKANATGSGSGGGGSNPLVPIKKINGIEELR